MKLGKTYFSGSLTFDEGNNRIGPNSSVLTGSLSGSVKGTFEGSFVGNTLTNISGAFDSVSSSLASRVASQESFSSSLDATFATDAQVATAVSSLNAATSSYLQNTTDTLTGDLTVTGTLTAQDLHVQEITSSIIYSSGSNVFGNQSTNTQELKGSTQIISNKGSELQEYNSFNVADDSDTTKGIRLAYDTGSDAGVIAASDLGTGWKDILINPIGGDVGIGTTNPTAKVSIKSSGASGIVLESDSSNSSNSGRIFFSNSSTGNAIMTESGILTFRTGATPRSTSGTKRLSVESSGIVTIGDGSNSGTLQFENDIKTRKVVLYQGADNDNQFYGFGIENSTLVYSVYTTSDDHVFFAGTSSTTRNELMRIGGDGKVGIGTSSPAGLLEINGGTGVATSGGTLIVRQDGDANTDGIALTSSNAISHRIWKDVNGKLNIGPSTLPSALVQDLSGKVGIGSATPEEKLTVDGTTSGAYIRISNAASGDISSGIMIYNGSNLDTQIYTNPTFGNTTFLSREALAIRAGGSQRMGILSDGNVGIATTSPQSQLHVSRQGNSNGGTILMGVGGSGTNKYSVLAGAHYNQASGAGNGAGSAGIMLIGSYATNGENDVIIGGNVWEVNAATTIRFYTHTTDTSTNGGTERMRITAGGSVGIGTTLPSGKLNVETNGNHLHLRANTATAGKYWNFDITSNNQLYIINNGGTGMTILDNGNVGIGTTSPSQKLHINGASAHLNFTGSNNRILFNGFRALEGSHDGATLQLGENYSKAVLYSDVGIGTTDPKTRLQVNEGAIGMSNTTGLPLNARLVKTGSTSILITIKVGAIGAWRAGHAFLKVSGARNGLEEHHSAWYHLKLVHYYLSGVTQSGTSNPALIRDSGGDTGNYILSVTATNNANPQEITINISDSGSTTNSMIADIDCSFVEGIHDLY